jgi:tetratricopeptide (TPR) repeat protein
MFFILLAPLTFLKEKVHCSLMTDSHLPADAVAAALAQNWKEAIRINLGILKTDKDSVEALSRLAYAYLKTGQLTQAKKTYEKVLSLDQYNHIAQKNLKKLGTLKKKDIASDSDHHLSPLMFLEEPGKTKIVDCIHLAPKQVISTLSAGEDVQMKAKNHCIEIRSSQNTYIAALPDDLSFKLIKMLEAGNTYQAIVKGIEKNGLKVLIRELSRGKRFANQPSFTTTTSYIPFAKGGSSSNSEAPDMTPTGEEGDAPEPEEGMEN